VIPHDDEPDEVLSQTPTEARAVVAA
jgi:hypothetical protein